jgi:UDP-N-acetylmuramoyl-tripeptide--D-alanyl-D-alanine ligase
LKSLLSGRFRTVGGIKSYNNAVGVPLTLFGASEETEILVCELGSNHPGEMASLSEIVQADLVILTRIARSHLEFFDDTVGVAREKSALFASLRAGGIAVLNTDSPHLDVISAVLVPGVRRVTYALEKDAEYRAEGLRLNERHGVFRLKGQPFDVPLPGRGSSEDALAALTASHLLGVPLESGAAILKTFKPLSMRMEFETVDGIEVVNDSYNASPDAVIELLRTFREREGTRTVFVLGDMRELGESSRELHREVGRRFVDEGHRSLVTLGDESEDISIAAREAGLTDTHHFRTLEEVANYLAHELRRGDRVILKASRAMSLEKLIPLLKKKII